MDFDKKVGVVTGGANGIGRCIVEAFSKAGALVAFVDIDEGAGSRLSSRIGEEKALYYAGSLTEEAVLRGFADAVIRRFGHVDFLVNNACISCKGILSGCGFDDFNDVLKLGVTAPYMLSKLFLDSFAPSASIVNISSTRAFMSQPDTESYTAAKGGISALTHALSISLAGRVRVNSVSPGWIDTSAYHDDVQTPVFSAQDCAQHPAGRIGTPMDISNAVMYLCSDAASFIDGENIVIDGGMTRQMIYHDDFGWRLK